ncbi:MAG TPA: hypothetical protein VND45_00840, partial [Thermoanaerobaculia bacterium]|nr:hypothetical protein [Thermoanaerobaculia bacterium]
MKLAILGTRGVPPNYGGFETFAGELSTRLVARGHEVWVYCRDSVVESTSRPVDEEQRRAPQRNAGVPPAGPEASPPPLDDSTT